MLRRLVLALVLPWTAAAVATAQTAPPRERCLPSEAVLSVELVRPAALLDLLRNEEFTEFVTGLPLWRAFAKTPDYEELRNVVTYLEGALGVDWRTGLEGVTGGGITFAVGPNEAVLLVVEATDAALLGRLHDILLSFARGDHPARVVSERHGEVTVWSFDGQERHAVVGNLLLFSNRAAALDRALDLLAGESEDGLAATRAYRAAMDALDPAAIVRAFVDLGRLKLAPGVRAALDQDRIHPLASLLFAPITEAAREATWLAAGAWPADGGFEVRARVDGDAADPRGAAAFALPARAGDGPLPNLEVPGRIAAVSLFRDLHRFYAAKDELFPERTSSLIFFENMMGIFFSGRDLTDEVLAATRPDIRLVVAKQAYDPALGTPEVKIPAFAAVIGLRDAAGFGEVIEEAWQKALGLVNFTRGQEALPGLIIDRAVRGDTTYTVAYFSAAGIEDRTRLHERYNFRPTLALPGDWVVLSSTEGLARDLIDALEAGGEDAAPLDGTSGVLEIDGEELHAALAANRESLVLSNMVDEGNTREQAEEEIGVLLSLARLVGGLDVTLDARDGVTETRLALRVNIPDRRTGKASATGRPGASGR